VPLGIDHRKYGILYRTMLIWLAGMATLTGILLFLSWHWAYYSLIPSQRPLHPNHFMLRPSGLVGLLLGIIAASLFVLNLGYLVRKQLITASWLGPLRTWMDMHVLTGLIGMGLVTLHSALAPVSVLGSLASVALVSTILTGIVGRTIYIQVPRSLEGRELEFQQVQSRLDACRRQLEQVGVQADWLRLSKPPQEEVLHKGLVQSFLSMLVGDRQRRREYRRLKHQILEAPELQTIARQILPLTKEFCVHWQWLKRYYELRGLIASWRFFHLWMAVLMLCVVIAHVVLAVRFGNLSLWGGAQ
jgi:hypothetical protein